MSKKHNEAIREIEEWLCKNKIQYNVQEDDIVDIKGMGLVFVEDTDSVKSIFRKDEEGNVLFNSSESLVVLESDEIFYIAFKFGDNWYYFDIRKDFKFNILKYVGERKPCEHKNRFVNLGIHTPFELLNGSFSISDWIRKAKYLGQDAIGICDENTMAATFNLQKECKAAGMKHVFGYSLTFTDQITEDDCEKVGAKVYVQSQRGLQNLLKIQRKIGVDSSDKTISKEDLLSLGDGNVIVFDKYSSQWLVNHPEEVKQFKECFNHCYYQLDLSEYKAERIDIRVLESTKLYFDNIFNTGMLQPVLISDCYYLDKDDAKNKIILNKIADGAAHEQSDDQYFKDLDEHWETISAILDPDKWDVGQIFDMACNNTCVISDGAEAFFDTSRNYMPQYDMKPEEKAKYGTRHNMFLQLLEEGFKKLVPKSKEEIYRKQLEYEIYVLESTNNVDYMLVQYDTVNWARENGILVGCGRGSAGGCLVLYLIGVTLIDPIKYHLLFERFLLPERAGLYSADVTIIGDDIESKSYVQLELENGRTYNIDKDAQLIVKREGEEEPVVVYADELQEGDDIQFDNRDLLFTLEEI